MSTGTRTERDSMGEVRLPADAYAVHGRLAKYTRRFWINCAGVGFNGEFCFAMGECRESID